MGVFNKIKSGFQQIGSNIKRGLSPFIKNPIRESIKTAKALTRNTRQLVQAGSEVLEKGLGSPLGNLVSVPAYLAAKGVDYTLGGLEMLEDTIAPNINPERLKKGQFVKKSKAGRALEQFVRGDIGEDVRRVKGVSIDKVKTGDIPIEVKEEEEMIRKEVEGKTGKAVGKVRKAREKVEKAKVILN